MPEKVQCVALLSARESSVSGFAECPRKLSVRSTVWLADTRRQSGLVAASEWLTSTQESSSIDEFMMHFDSVTFDKDINEDVVEDEVEVEVANENEDEDVVEDARSRSGTRTSSRTRSTTTTKTTTTRSRIKTNDEVDDDDDENDDDEVEDENQKDSRKLRTS